MAYKKGITKFPGTGSQQTFDALSEVSDSFCLAKWLQVTLHLQNGHNHSCHHPVTHRADEDEIANNPNALHNTLYKKAKQAQMLTGERPTECQYCWNIEDIGKDSDDTSFASDRIHKSGDITWAGTNQIQPLLDKIKRGEKINPRYVEISFSNVCNFKCSYCSPVHSSLWTSEIKNKGPYELLSNPGHNNLEWLEKEDKLPIHHKDYNPYVEAFWEWWPDLVQDLVSFRITGGEPLLEENTFKAIKMLQESETGSLKEMSINSNACVPDEVIDRYILEMNKLLDSGKVEISRFFTSCDTHGEQAEYIRHGFDYKRWLKNVDKILTEIPKSRVTIMCTANLMSLPRFHLFLQDVHALKKKHWNNPLKGRDQGLTLDIPILRHPAHQSVAILPSTYADMLTPSLVYMTSHWVDGQNRDAWTKRTTNKFSPDLLQDIQEDDKMFTDLEMQRFQRLIKSVEEDVNVNEGVNSKTSMIDFYLFVNEHDRRRGTDFKKTFPELMDFYRLCEEEHNKRIMVRNI